LLLKWEVANEATPTSDLRKMIATAREELRAALRIGRAAEIDKAAETVKVLETVQAFEQAAAAQWPTRTLPTWN
jgi:hypothetical protein